MSQGRVLVVDDIKLMGIDDNTSRLDALLADLEMPGTDGSKLIAYFKSAYPMIPIIHNIERGVRFRTYRSSHPAGVIDWLRKPSSREKILEKVRVAVRLHQLRVAQGHLWFLFFYFFLPSTFGPITLTPCNLFLQAGYFTAALGFSTVCD